MSDSFEAVLFDIDDTLCEYRRGVETMLPLAFERAGVEPFFTREVYVSRFGSFLDESDDMEDLRERVFVSIARDCGRDPDQGRAVARAYAAERDHSNVQFREGARHVLDSLDGSYRLGAVTNGPREMQSTKLDALGVACFETVVYAGSDAPAKPAPEPFELALDRLGVSPQRALYVGNSIDTDVAGAQSAGLSAALLSEDPQQSREPQPDILLSRLGELLEKLSTL